MQRTKHYHFVGRNQLGHTLRGELDAINKTLATICLHQQGITVKKLYQKPGVIKQYFYPKRLITRDTIAFTQQLSTLLRAKVPLIQALELLNHQFASSRLKPITQAIYYDVKTGLSLAQSLKKHPSHFHRNQFPPEVIAKIYYLFFAQLKPSPFY